MRIKHKVNVRVGYDTDMNNLLFGPSDELSEVIIDAYSRVTSGLVRIAEDTTEDLPLGDVETVKGIYLKVNQDVQIVLNDGTDVIQLRKPTASTSVYARLFLEADITKVTITAPETLVVEGVYCVWGDSA